MWRIILFLLVSSSLSYGQGINFSKKSWDDVLKQAKTNNKIIFLDAYTTWCAPCKQMDKEVYSDREVGIFYNKSFINVKFDMEKGYGKTLRKKYKIEAFPTFLFINGDGDVTQAGQGFKAPKAFIDLGQGALDHRLDKLRKAYYSSDKSDAALESYLKNIGQINEEFNKMAQVYLDRKERLDTASIWFMTDLMNSLRACFAFEVETPFVLYGAKHLDRFRNVTGMAFENYLMGAVEQTARRNGISNTDKEEMLAFASLYLPSYMAQKRTNSLYLSNKSFEVNSAKELDKFLKEIEEFDHYEYANNRDITWSFGNAINNNARSKADLEKALYWTKESAMHGNNFLNTSLMAEILFKLKKYKKAKLWAEASVALSKVEGYPYDEMEDLLKKINVALEKNNIDGE